MNTRQWIGAVITGLMATTAMLGSISGLVAFAEQGLAAHVTVYGLDVPLGALAFVAGIDGLTIAMTVQVHDHDRGVDWLAVAVLVVVTSFSALLQFLAAPDGWKPKTVHTVPAPFAGLAAAMFFHSLGARRPDSTTRSKPKPKPASSAPETARSALPAPPHAAPPGPDAYPALAVVGGRRTDVDEDQLVAEVDAWLAGQDRPPSKASVKDAGAALGLPCRGNERALAVAAAVRDRRAKAS